MHLHPECLQGGCRRGQDATPCRIPGGCEAEWQPACALCGHDLSQGHICAKCAHGIRSDLNAILHLTAQAHAQTIPRQGTGNGARSVPGSKPPLDVTALDPELVLVRLVPDDESSEVPMLVLLEDWERIIREDRGLVPYGLASEARLAQAGALHAQNYTAPLTLIGVIGFLQHHHEWVCSEPSFDIAEYARQVRLCRKAVARWDMTSEPPGWRVPCPTVTDDGECGQIVKIQRGHEHAYCKRCERSWDVAHLIAVAGRDADVWVDVEAAATLAGVHERTIRKWVQRGNVRKRGQLVRVLDIKHNALGLTGS